MSDILRPDSPGAVLDIVKWAVSERTPMEVIGHGTKRGIGRSVQAAHTIDLTDLSGITLYEPDELVLSALAGTPLSEIEDALGDNDQELAFEPIDYARLQAPNGDTAKDRDPARTQATIGGVLAANLAGPRRIKAGAARDHILGVSAVSGRAETFKSGGRVVKNVTGYDLSKGLAGSWGTLAVATHVTFKVLPRAETEATLLIHGLDTKSAISELCRAMGSSCEVSSAAHLPGTLQQSESSRSRTALRLEGFEKSVAYRLNKLKDVVGSEGQIETLDETSSRTFWRSIKDALPLAGADRPLWRLSVAPAQAPTIVEEIEQSADISHFFDWSGGLVWIQINDASNDAMASIIRSAIKSYGGGHATLVRGSATLRASIDPFEPQDPALAALSQRLKENFDPHGILNPGRLSKRY